LNPGEAPAACNPNLAPRLAQVAQIGGEFYSYSSRVGVLKDLQSSSSKLESSEKKMSI